MNLFSTWKTFIVLKYKMAFEYKGAFWAATFSQVLWYGVDFLLMWVLVSRFKTLAGWSADEIIFLYSIHLITYAAAGTFFFNSCISLSGRVQSGAFDDSLMVPLHPLLYEVMSNYNTDYIRHICLAVIVFIVSLVRLDLAFNPLKIVLLILFLIGGTLIQAGALLIFSAPNFWIIRGDKLLDLFYYETITFIRYPISIYPVVLQGILTFVLPYSFINFYPAGYFLGKNDFTIFHPSLQYLTPLVGCIVFAFGVFFWNRGLKKYQSTGS
ncbi:ABC-2 family transporter protein [Anaerocolumna sp. AGMB13020]|uniref:ABC transporter permease n=1 Tax=Anaerocolumna sp. AGMB13020 TaxID=3081750 RepID=UPI002954B729|nr:ABC-2 family transporter protein [Anaerocolumna sp. AGMB13020]WOO34832.1 ABC-2 family transporter protein [Anaerocolumna sp. AGMB13020]